MKLFQYINAHALFRDYLPDITCKYLKMRGMSTNGKPMYFSEDEKKRIIAAINQMAKDTKAKYAKVKPEDLY